MPASAALLRHLVVLALVRQRVPSVVVGLAQHLPGQAHGLISENLAAATVPGPGSTGRRRRCDGRKVGVHFDVRQMALQVVNRILVAIKKQFTEEPTNGMFFGNPISK